MRILTTCLIILISIQLIDAQSLRGETVKVKTDLKASSYDFSNARVATESVFAPTADEECGNEVVIYTLNNTWGTVAGMNGFMDIQKAQRLHFESSDVYDVIGIAAFVLSASAVVDGNLYMNVYSVNEDDGGPEEYLGTATPMLVSQLVLPGDDGILAPTVFQVPDDSVMQITQSSFYVSYDFSELYFTDDTVSVAQTNDMCGAEDDTWEQFFPDDTSDLAWGPVSSTWGLNFDLHVAAVVEFDDLVSADDFIASQDLKIYPASPNPARDYVQLNFEVDGRTDVTFEVFDVNGGRMYRTVREKVSLGRQAEIIDVSQFPAGSYYYRVATDKGEMMSRFLIGE